jgi:ribosomal protein S12 methylthiotransferase accessory factor
MVISGTSAPIRNTQFGERGTAVEQAWLHGEAAAADLALVPEMTPLLDGSPGTWRCMLHRQESQVPDGWGYGKGYGTEAKVGALFEALEHYLSGLCGLSCEDIILCHAHDVAIGALTKDTGAALLTEGPNDELACLTHRSLLDENQIAIPLAFFMPHYLDTNADPLREQAGDHYNYTRISRYSANIGWAAGVDPVDATVHALNEIIERDAMSLLLIHQFLNQPPRPLRITDPHTLPSDLVTLLDLARAYTGGEIYLIDMTTDLGIPAYWAYLPPSPGQTARIRGCGTSLSRHHAISRALCELIQFHTVLAPRPHQPITRLVGYPALHDCYRADFTPAFPTATYVNYQDTPTPANPQEHLTQLVTGLHHNGFTPYLRQHYVTEHVAVIHVAVPGLERFMLTTTDQLVIPGPRGLAATNLKH